MLCTSKRASILTYIRNTTVQLTSARQCSSHWRAVVSAANTIVNSLLHFYSPKYYFTKGLIGFEAIAQNRRIKIQINSSKTCLDPIVKTSVG